MREFSTVMFLVFALLQDGKQSIHWTIRAERAKVSVEFVYVYVDCYITRILISATSKSLDE